MTRRTLFPYSGSKARLIKHLPAPPEGTTTIIEPFAGSLAYSMHYRPQRLICAEASPDVRRLLRYLSERFEPRLRYLESLPIERVTINVFAEKHGLSEAEQTLVRLFTSGAYKGQLSSKILYPQHKMKLDHDTIDYFASLGRESFLMADDFRRVYDLPSDDTTWTFIDPPYMGTKANYAKGCGNMDAAAVMRLTEGRRGIMTYHDPDAFPALEWQVACVRKVPNMRKGGTTERTEWFAVFGCK